MCAYQTKSVEVYVGEAAVAGALLSGTKKPSVGCND